MKSGPLTKDERLKRIRDSMSSRFRPYDISFANLLKIRIGDLKQDSPGKYNLIAVCNKYDLIFAAASTTLKVLRASKLDQRMRVGFQQKRDIMKEICDFDFSWSLNLEHEIVHVSVNSDGGFLSVCLVKNGGFVFAEIYDVRAFADYNTPPVPFQEFKLTSAPTYTLEDFSWNPGEEFVNMFASCTSDGVVTLFEVQPSCIKVLGSLRPSGDSTMNTCICWSPKGKQFLAGRSSGEVVQYDQKMIEKKVIQPSDDIVAICQEPSVVAAFWETPYSFFVAYKSKRDDTMQPQLSHISTKAGQITHKLLEDVCFGDMNNESMRYQMMLVKEWNLMLVASSTAVEIAILIKREDTWSDFSAPEGGRPEIPNSDDFTSNGPRGMAISYNSSFEYKPDETKPTSPPSLLLLTLSTNGCLIVYYILNPTSESIVYRPEPLLAEGALRGRGVQSNRSALQEQPVQDSSINQNNPSSSFRFENAPIIAGEPLPVNKAAAVKTDEQQQEGKFSFFSPGVKAFSLGKRPELHVLQEQQPKPAQPQQYSQQPQQFGQQPQQFSQQPQQFSQQPQQFTQQPQQFSQQPQRQLPAYQKLPQSLLTSKPLQQSKPSGPEFSDILPSNRSEESLLSLSAIGKPIDQSTPQNFNVKSMLNKHDQSGHLDHSVKSSIHLPSASVALNSLKKSKDAMNSDPYIASIIEEVTHFEKEMKDAIGKYSTSRVPQRSREDIKKMTSTTRSLVESVNAICKELLELKSDVDTCRTETIELQAGLERCKYVHTRDNDPEYLILLKQRPLNKERKDKLAAIEAAICYTEREIAKADCMLESKWEAYEDAVKKKRFLQPPRLQVLYETLSGNKITINRAKYRLKEIKKNMENNPQLAREHFFDLSQRFTANCSLLPSGFTPAKKISAKKEAQLREILINRRAVPVWTTAPKNLSSSKFISVSELKKIENLKSAEKKLQDSTIPVDNSFDAGRSSVQKDQFYEQPKDQDKVQQLQSRPQSSFTSQIRSTPTNVLPKVANLSAMNLFSKGSPVGSPGFALSLSADKLTKQPVIVTGENEDDDDDEIEVRDESISNLHQVPANKSLRKVAASSLDSNKLKDLLKEKDPATFTFISFPRQENTPSGQKVSLATANGSASAKAKSSASAASTASKVPFTLIGQQKEKEQTFFGEITKPKTTGPLNMMPAGPEGARKNLFPSLFTSASTPTSTAISSATGRDTSAASDAASSPLIAASCKPDTSKIESGTVNSSTLPSISRPLFGVTTQSVFGVGQTSGASLFGRTSLNSIIKASDNVTSTTTTTTAATTTSTSLFGSTTSAAACAVTETTTAKAVVTTITSASVFGTALSSVSVVPTVFGSPTSENATRIAATMASSVPRSVNIMTASTLDGEPATITTSVSSIFGNVENKAAPSIFGSIAASPSVDKNVVETTKAAPSIFGNLAATSTTASPETTRASTVFGNVPAATTQSVFGSIPASTSTPSVFGSSNSSNQSVPATSVFGSALPSVFGAGSGNSSFIGGNSSVSTGLGDTSGNSQTFGESSGFGSVPASTTATLFGAAPASSKPVFGVVPASTTSLFGAVHSSSTSVFGAASASSTSVFGAATTSTTSVFGASPASATSVFGASKPVFGVAPASSTSVFGAAPASSTSSFGAAPASTTSVFGAAPASSTSLFGAAAASSKSVFGAAPTSSTSVFGAAPASTNSVFGAAPASTTSVFGAAPASATSVFGAAPASTTSVFGAAPASATSLFGAAAASTTSVFGAAPASTNSVFGAAPAPSNSVFGAAPTSPFGQSAFGNTSQQVFGQPSASAFGQNSVFGQTTPAKVEAPAGGLFSSGGFFGGLGGKPSEEKAAVNVFGNVSALGSSNQSSGVFGDANGASVFGSLRTNANIQGAFSGNSVGVASAGFGGFQKPAAPAFGGAPSGFGAAPVFGSPAAGGGFGQSAFGAAPSFGGLGASSPNSFGNAQSKLFGSGDSIADGFASLAQQSGVSSFGSPVQQPSGFGSLAGGGGERGFGASSFQQKSPQFTQFRS